MKSYVVGFMFSNDRQFVALIRKNRPEWQAGKLNGIGGKIEDGEIPRGAMVREFREETGLETRWEDWTIRGRIEGPEFRVYILQAWSNKVFDAKTVTDENVIIFAVDKILLLDNILIPNLKAIIPALLLEDLQGIFLSYL